MIGPDSALLLHLSLVAHVDVPILYSFFTNNVETTAVFKYPTTLILFIYIK